MTSQTLQKQLCREIAKRFSIGLEDAQEILEMTYREAKKINNNGYRGDLENIGWIEALKTLDSIDLTKGAKPSTCCYRPMRKAMIREMQRESLYKENKEEVSENIPDNTSSQDENLFKHERIQFLIGCLEKLPIPTKTVLHWRFGLGGEEKLTLKDIGIRLKLSKQRIKQIEEDGINSLQQLFHEKGFL